MNTPKRRGIRVQKEVSFSEADKAGQQYLDAVGKRVQQIKLRNNRRGNTRVKRIDPRDPYVEDPRKKDLLKRGLVLIEGHYQP